MDRPCTIGYLGSMWTAMIPSRQSMISEVEQSTGGCRGLLQVQLTLHPACCEVLHIRLQSALCQDADPDTAPSQASLGKAL